MCLALKNGFLLIEEEKKKKKKLSVRKRTRRVSLIAIKEDLGLTHWLAKPTFQYI